MLSRSKTKMSKGMFFDKINKQCEFNELKKERQQAIKLQKKKNRKYKTKKKSKKNKRRN